MWLEKDQGERVELRKQEEEQTAWESEESRLLSQKMGENQETGLLAPPPRPPAMQAVPLGVLAQKGPPGLRKPPPSLSLPELQLLFIALLHRDHSQGSGQVPRFLGTGSSFTYWWRAIVE